MQRKKLAPWILGDGPAPVLPALTDKQKKTITPQLQISFSKSDWQIIESARNEFCWCHWAAHHAVEYKNLQKRMNRVARASRSLLTALSQEGSSNTQSLPTGLLLDKTWLFIEMLLNSPQPLPFKILDLMTILHRLDSRARLVLETVERTSKLDVVEHDWNHFVGVLSGVFEKNGLLPSAAKWGRSQGAKLSPFVRFVLAIVMTLPPECRQHVHSETAMAKAVAHALANRRQHKQNSAGPITAID
jgi:hypothetical protein